MPRSDRKRTLQAKRSPRTLRATAALDAPTLREREEPRPSLAQPSMSPLPAEVARQSQREMDRLREELQSYRDRVLPAVPGREV